jgi:hypothetical protein
VETQRPAGRCGVRAVGAIADVADSRWPLPPADALIAGAYLAGTNTRALRSVSRVWRKVKGDWEAWNSRSLADEPIVRLILDGTVW